MKELSQLIEACKSGKRKAQSELYQMFAPKLFGICIRYSRDTSEAEDTLHEAFMKIFSKIGQYNGKGSFEGWMTRIAINIALAKYRKRYKLQIVEDISIYDNKINDENIYQKMSHDQLLKFVNELPPRYRMVFNLYAIEGFGHKEIADLMDITEGTSKSNLSRARKILQEKLFEMGYIRKEYAK